MKFGILIFFSFIIAVTASKRPYTTPSPFGSVRFKQFKCECTRKMNLLTYPNFTCFAKAVSRDVTTLNAYAKLKRNLEKVWISGFLEYKYGTIYRPVITAKKRELCEVLQFIDDAKYPLMHVIMKIAKQVAPPGMLHSCPYKIGEEFGVSNITIPLDQMPSVFPQGDYRAKIFVNWPNEDEQLCEDTIVYSMISPIKESFG